MRNQQSQVLHLPQKTNNIAQTEVKSSLQRARSPLLLSPSSPFPPSSPLPLQDGATKFSATFRADESAECTLSLLGCTSMV